MNADTIFCYRNDYPTGHPFQTATSQLAATTTETLLLTANGTNMIASFPSLTSVYGSSTPMDPLANSALSANVLGSSSDRRNMAAAPYFTPALLDGRPFMLSFAAKGAAVTGAVNTLTLALYVGAVAGVGTATNQVFNSGALAMATTHPFSIYVQMVLFWDSVQQSLGGEFWCTWGYNGTFTYIGRAILPYTSFTIATAAGLTFFPSMQWASAAGTITVTEFSLSLV